MTNDKYNVSFRSALLVKTISSTLWLLHCSVQKIEPCKKHGTYFTLSSLQHKMNRQVMQTSNGFTNTQNIYLAGCIILVLMHGTCLYNILLCLPVCICKVIVIQPCTWVRPVTSQLRCSRKCSNMCFYHNQHSIYLDFQ